MSMKLEHCLSAGSKSQVEGRRCVECVVSDKVPEQIILITVV